MSVTGPSALRGSPWASQANGTSHHRALPMEKHGVHVWGEGRGPWGLCPASAMTVVTSYSHPSSSRENRAPLETPGSR